MASLELRGKIWHIRWRDKRGKLRSESTHIPTGEVGDGLALKALEGFKKRIQRGLDPAPKVNIGKLLDGLVTDYAVNARKSSKDLSTRIEQHLRPWFGLLRADRLNTADAKEYVAARQAEGAANGTINREMAALQRALALGRIGGLIESVPHLPKLKEPPARRGFFEPSQVDALVECLPEDYRPFVRFLYLTGWRVSEVRGLCWRHIDFDAGEIRLDPGSTKNDDARTFPMTTELRSLLEGRDEAKTAALLAAEEARDGGKAGSTTGLVDGKLVAAIAKFVFSRRRGKEGPFLPIGDFRKVWARACKDAGLPVVLTPVKDAEGNQVILRQGPDEGKPAVKIQAEAILHDFRRAAVRNLVRAGIPERVAMTMTGHKTRSVFERYNIVSRGDLETAREKLEAFAISSQSKIVSIKRTKNQ